MNKEKINKLKRMLIEKAEKDMNIYAEEGDKIIYEGSSDTQELNFMDNNTVANAKKYLKVGDIYTVKQTFPLSWVTFVELKEFPDVYFNSIHFKDSLADEV